MCVCVCVRVGFAAAAVCGPNTMDLPDGTCECMDGFQPLDSPVTECDLPQAVCIDVSAPAPQDSVVTVPPLFI